MSGVLLGGLAAVGLIAFYCLKLRRLPVRVSTTAFWESAVRDLQANAPLRLLRTSWLLLLHALIAASLCIAAARPSLDLPDAPGGRTVILLDLSASMSAVDAPDPARPQGRRSRLEEAREVCGRIIEDAAAGAGSAMILAFAARPVTVANFTRDAQQLRSAVASVAGTDEPANFDAAWQVASALAAPSGSDPSPARIVLVSDGCVALSSKAIAASGGAELHRFYRVGPAPAEAGTVHNVGIVALNAQRDFQDPGMVHVFARLVSSARQALQVPVEWSWTPGSTPGGTETPDPSESRGARVLAFGAGSPDVPGEASLSFDLRTNQGGVVTVRINRPDALAADDSASVVLAGARRLSIELVEGVGVDSSRDGLRAALETLEAGTLRVKSISQYEAAPASPGLDLLVFDGAQPSRLPPGVPTLSLGAGLPIAGLRLAQGGGPAGGGMVPFVQWDRSHPVMRYLTLGEVRLSRDRWFGVAEGSEAAGAQPTPVAWTASGPAILVLYRSRTRHILVAPGLNESTWARDLGFPTFVANAVDYLTLRAEHDAGKWFAAGEAVEVPVDDGAGAPEQAAQAQSLVMRAPDGTVVRKVVAEVDGRYLLGAVPRAGLYQVEEDGRARPVAVNLLDATESAARTVDRVEVGRHGASSEAGAGRGAREVWSWFVGLALGLLCVEWLLFAWRSRL